MTQRRLTRRTFLRGLGGVAVSLPRPIAVATASADADQTERLRDRFNALDQAAPLAEWDLPPEFATLRRLMEAR